MVCHSARLTAETRARGGGRERAEQHMGPDGPPTAMRGGPRGLSSRRHARPVCGAPGSQSRGTWQHSVWHGPRPRVCKDTLSRQMGHPKGSQATSQECRCGPFSGIHGVRTCELALLLPKTWPSCTSS